jgi:hypothetical protein
MGLSVSTHLDKAYLHADTIQIFYLFFFLFGNARHVKLFFFLSLFANPRRQMRL